MRPSSYLALLILATASCLSAQTSDLASSQLLAIAEKEAKIYKKVAEDPEFYSESDLDRRINELILAYRAYVVENPEDVSALILYGKLLRRVEQYEQAFIIFLKADELDPEIAVIKQQIGTHLAEEGKGKAALLFYLRAVDLEPEVAAYQFALGQLLLDYRDDFVEEALFTQDALEREMLKAFQNAARLEPENFNFQMRLGEAYYDLESPDWKSALLHWNQLRKQTRTQLQGEIIDLHRARVMGRLGRQTEALALTESIFTPALQQSKQEVIDEIAQF